MSMQSMKALLLLYGKAALQLKTILTLADPLKVYLQVHWHGARAEHVQQEPGLW